MDWSITNGPTPSSQTGPDADHTTADTNQLGFYYYLEQSSQSPGNKAVLVSSSLPLISTQRCLTFWYHMYGQHIGALEVRLATSAADIANASPFWTKTLETLSDDNSSPKDGLNEWRLANLTIPGNMQVISFTAVTGGTGDGQPFGDIAMDDIKTDDGACGAINNQTIITSPMPNTTTSTTEKPTTTTTTSTPASTTSTNTETMIYEVTTSEGPANYSSYTTYYPGTTTPPISTGFTLFSCNFDYTSATGAFCNMTQSRNDNLDFVRQTGPTPSTDTGPSGDHTTGYGYYIYVEATLASQDDFAEIFLPTLSSYLTQPMNVQTVCLSFWYHMYGSAMGSLVIRAHNGNTSRVIWTKTDNGKIPV
jgi:hypothetical protein